MNQVISCHLRLIYVFIFQQTASILNSLHPTIHCGHGIHYCCRSTFFELGVYSSLLSLLCAQDPTWHSKSQRLSPVLTTIMVLHHMLLMAMTTLTTMTVPVLIHANLRILRGEWTWVLARKLAGLIFSIARTAALIDWRILKFASVSAPSFNCLFSRDFIRILKSHVGQQTDRSIVW